MVVQAVLAEVGQSGELLSTVVHALLLHSGGSASAKNPKCQIPCTLVVVCGR